MSNRRHFLQQTAAVAALAALSPLLPRAAWAANGPLLQRAIPSSGERLPAIGLGTAGSFNVDAGSEDLAALRRVLDTLVSGGARLIDTAPSYGAAEAVAGQLVAEIDARGKVFFATKVSATGKAAGQAQIDASFKALRSDTLDLIQVHNLQDTATQLATLRELKAQGRVRYIGITHYLDSYHDELLATLRREKVDFVQFNYSVGDRAAEKTLLPYCADQGIATLINRPFQRGNLLSAKKNVPLPPLAAELGATSWAQLALKFILGHPAVTTVIPATSTPRYMADNLLAGQGAVPDTRQREAIAALFG